MKPVLLVPICNQGEPFKELAEALNRYELPVLVIDDGSDRETREILRGIDQKYEQFTLLHHEQNLGKGKAMKTGMTYAANQGYTHALQIDADYQHDPSDIPLLLKQARAHPDALVLGIPSFDESVPNHRYYFRYLTHIWVWIETVSFDIPDALCGYRVYPLRRSLDVMRCYELDNRMAFDPGFAVRYYWDGGEIRCIDTIVRYPNNHLSNYNPIADTIRISWMHFRSVLGMLYRLPELFRRTCSKRESSPSST